MYRKLTIRSIILILSLILGVLAGRFYFSDVEYRFLTNRTERIIERKTGYIREHMDLVWETGVGPEAAKTVAERIDFNYLRSKGMTILVYAGPELVFWSDKSFDLPAVVSDPLTDNPVRFFQNGYFLKETMEFGDTTIVGLLRIFNVYDIANRYVSSGFNTVLRLPEGAGFSLTAEISDYHVNRQSGEYLFSIVFPESKENTLLIILPLFFWLVVLILSMLVADRISDILDEKINGTIALLSKVILYAIFFRAVLISFLPGVFMQTDLFQPLGFNLGKMVPSMGHLLVLSLLLADMARTFYKYFGERSHATGNTARDFLGFTLLLLPGTVMFIIFHQVMVAMVSQPNLVFEGYRISEVSFLPVIGITSLFFLILTPCFYILKVLNGYRETKVWAIGLALLINLILFADAALFGIKTGTALAAFFLFSIILLRQYSLKKMGLFNMATIFSILFALYGTWYISAISIQNEHDRLRVSAVAHASEHDLIAEYLLIRLTPVMEADTILDGMMSRRFFGKKEADEVSEHLRVNYFGDYWMNYDFSIVMCNEESSLLIDAGDEVAENCFGFFEEMIKLEGQNITGTPFYHIYSKTGRPSYMGKFYYELPSGGTNGLFIELFSFVNAFAEGYPELLTDRKHLRQVRLKDYSFAKYIDGTLVLNTGDFPYPKSESGVFSTESEFSYLSSDGFDHMVYRQDEATVIFSRPPVPFISRVISFAWLFLWLLLISAISAVLYKRMPGISIFELDLRQKLQSAFILIIFITFLGVGAGASYLSIQQYRNRHYDNLREKASSLYIELEHKLTVEPTLDEGWSDSKYLSLDDLLVKFSNVFFTDINLYDRNGMLLATSRPEIFSRNLTSRRMDKLAHISLSELSETEFIAWERIGKLEYLSIYVPFYNDRNELLAYLNVPYFRMQSIISSDISNLIVAIVNFSLLMILITMSIAVIISERITSPIRMLGDVLATVKLGKRSQRLTYTARDEIGELVNHYNKMVEELEESVMKLSLSEREFAWREMAKQIAHEIKNPLTPMKLNVQQLEKSWKDGKPGFDKKIEKFTRNQIEHIENLSSIATAFSSFARLPKAEPVNVDLLEQIKTTLELFKSSGNVTFRITCNQSVKTVVFADREHLNSIFSNLVKNAIQAIPHDRQGVVKVSLKLEGDRVFIKVSDNGTGIPEDLKGRLFTPYFTTKSSGSGLGLSIVKRLVEGMGGDISFRSERDEGTEFTIILPVLYSVERPE